jgi:hypothetical protein
MRPAAEPERYTKAKIFSEVGKKTEMRSHAEHWNESFIRGIPDPASDIEYPVSDALIDQQSLLHLSQGRSGEVFAEDDFPGPFVGRQPAPAIVDDLFR